MTLTYFSLVVIVLGLLGTIALAISLRRRPPQVGEAGWLPKSQLGEFEERLSGLRQVILVADQIEVPSQENAAEILVALIDNFAEGVRYEFVVPAYYKKSHGDAIVRKYHAIIKLAGELSGKNLDLDLFQLNARPVEPTTSDYPYLFYRFNQNGGQESIVAFRGDRRGVGIADQYRRLEPEIARSFLLTALRYLLADSAELRTTDKDVTFISDETVQLEEPNQNARTLVH